MFNFGLITSVNDPRENHEQLVDVIRTENDANFRGPNPLNPEELREQLEGFFRRNTRVGCFTVDRRPLDFATGSKVPMYFHLGWARARMWHQYAANHTGACLIFNRQRFEQSVQKTLDRNEWDVLSREVTYRDMALGALFDQKMINSNDFNGIMRTMRSWGQTSQILYFLKNRDWESENEYRFILAPVGKKIVEIEQPVSVSTLDSLEAIVLGENFPESSLDDIQSAINGINVGTFRCSWFRGAPQLTEFPKSARGEFN